MHVVGRYLKCLVGFARVACLHLSSDLNLLAHSVNHCACCSSTRGSQDAFQAAQWYYSSTWVKLVSEKSKVSRRNHCRSDPVRVQSTEGHRACRLRFVRLSQLGRVFSNCGRYCLTRCRVRAWFAASARDCYPGGCVAPSEVQG